MRLKTLIPFAAASILAVACGDDDGAAGTDAGPDVDAGPMADASPTAATCGVEILASSAYDRAG